MDDQLLARMADALDRLAPPPPPAADPLAHPAYLWRGDTLEPAREFRPLPLDRLAGIDAQKVAMVENARRLAAGLAAHDVLLWGARGSGKSALVKASIGALQAGGAAIALIEVPTDALATLPRLFRLIAGCPRAYLLFLDDLGFQEGSDAPRLLRSMLEGGAEARPANARLAVTANRRHLVSRSLDEQDSAINPRDVVDDKLALADRFGLSLGFHVCDQDTYLAMVQGYADALGLPLDPADALTFSVGRGGRSGRIAWHYVVDLAGRHGLTL